MNKNILLFAISVVPFMSLNAVAAGIDEAINVASSVTVTDDSPTCDIQLTSQPISSAFTQSEIKNALAQGNNSSIGEELAGFTLANCNQSLNVSVTSLDSLRNSVIYAEIGDTDGTGGDPTYLKYSVVETVADTGELTFNLDGSNVHNFDGSLGVYTVKSALSVDVEGDNSIDAKIGAYNFSYNVVFSNP